MANNIISNDITYSALIDSAATSLYNLVKNSSVGTGTFRASSVSFKIGSEVTAITGSNKTQTNQGTTVTLSATENRSESYTPPTQAKIVSDMKTFLSGVGVPTDSSVPTSDGAISFFFALNFFVEKAVIKRVITAPNNGSPTYHLHYKAPSASSYTKIPNSSTNDRVTVDKISNIYSQVKNTSLLSDNARTMSLSTAAHTSSSSSSSCSSSCSSSSSSSSCSSSCSSIFIAYFNLN